MPSANLREMDGKTPAACVQGLVLSIAGGVGKVLETITAHSPAVWEHVHHFFAGRDYSWRRGDQPKTCPLHMGDREL
jgi:hypothetical protein